MKSQKGFASVLLISILPIILAAGLAYFLSFSFFKSDLGLLNLCRAKQLEVQNKVGVHLEKLLKLNSRALKLRLSQVRAEKALMMAIKTGSPPAIAAAEAYLLSVKMRRQSLHFKQTRLIESANMNLALANTSLQRDLHGEWRTHSAVMGSWVKSSFQLTRSVVPKLTVTPDFPEIAPLYEPVPHFEEAQAWHQAWRQNFRTTSWVHKFLAFNGGFERSCSTSLYPENGHWIAKLKKDKSWSKGFF